MKTKYLFYFLVVSFVVAQQESTVTFLPQGFNIIQLGVNGYVNSTIADVSHISFRNPASIQEFNRVNLGVSAQFESSLNTAWIAGIGHQRLNIIQPQSFGLILPLKNIRLGIGFGQKYNTKLDFGEIKIRSIEFPEGTGETVQIEHETYITNKSFLLSYPVFRGNNQELLVIGSRIGINKLHVKQAIWKNSYQESISSYNWSLGISYSTQFPFVKRIKFDAYYEKDIEFKRYIEVSDSINFEQINEPILWSYYLVGNVPEHVSLGATLTITDKVRMLGSITKIYWNRVSDDFKNQVATSIAISYSPTKFLYASIGYFSTDRRYARALQPYELNDKFKSTFITTGIGLSYQNLDINFSLADSHLLGGEWCKQTIGNVSIGFHF